MEEKYIVSQVTMQYNVSKKHFGFDIKLELHFWRGKI